MRLSVNDPALASRNAAHVRRRVRFVITLLLAVACGGRSVRLVEDGVHQAGHGGSGASGRGGNANGGSLGLDFGGRPSAGDHAGTGAATGVGGVLPPMGGRGGQGAGESVAGTGSGVGGVGTNPYPCVPPDDESALHVDCKGGFVHRPDAGACELSPRTEAAAGGAGDGGAPGGECASDLDCSESSRGYCVSEFHYVKLEIRCVYACRTDADCQPTEVCACDRTYVDFVSQAPLALGVCEPATCTLDAQCRDGFLCISPVEEECGPGHVGAFHCQTENDECGGPGDCTNGESCAFRDARFVCESQLTC